MNPNINMNITTILSLILSIALIVLEIVGRWRILTDRNEKGWKSLIPFLSTYTFGKTFKQEKLANIINVVALLLSLISIGSRVLQVMKFDLMKIGVPLVVTVLILGLILFVLSVIFHKRFCQYNNASALWTIVWALAPTVAVIYFAFIHKNAVYAQTTSEKEIKSNDYFDLS